MALGMTVQTVGFAQLNDDNSWLLNHTENIRKNSENIVGDGWLKEATTFSPEAIKHAKAIREGMVKANPMANDAGEGKDFKTDQIYQNLLFISYSLGDEGLNDVLEVASYDQSIALVMRGIPEGMDVWEGMAQIQQMAAEFEPMPNIVLDPTLFDKYKVEVVPTLVLIDQEEPEPEDKPTSLEEMEKKYNPLHPDYELNTLPTEDGDETALEPSTKSKEIARVSGLSDPTWLKRKVDHEETGDFGIKGPVLEIAERDLVEVMKERVLQIDWEEKKRLAKERYWSNQTFIYLPTNTKEQIRHVDASVTATRDIMTSDGQFIAHAGDTVNPLDTRPFTQAIIVFDPTEKRQMHWIRDALPAIEQSEGVKSVMYIATQFETDDGWDNYEALTDEVDAHVYLLTSDVKDRFELRSTPSVITANSTHFVIHELFKPENVEIEQ